MLQAFSVLMIQRQDVKKQVSREDLFFSISTTGDFTYYFLHDECAAKYHTEFFEIVTTCLQGITWQGARNVLRVYYINYSPLQNYWRPIRSSVK